MELDQAGSYICLLEILRLRSASAPWTVVDEVQDRQDDRIKFLSVQPALQLLGVFQHQLVDSLPLALVVHAARFFLVDFCLQPL